MGCKHTYDCGTKIGDLCPYMFLIGYNIHAVCSGVWSENGEKKMKRVIVMK